MCPWFIHYLLVSCGIYWEIATKSNLISMELFLLWCGETLLLCNYWKSVKGKYLVHWGSSSTFKHFIVKQLSSTLEHPAMRRVTIKRTIISSFIECVSDEMMKSTKFRFTKVYSCNSLTSGNVLMDYQDWLGNPLETSSRQFTPSNLVLTFRQDQE